MRDVLTRDEGLKRIGPGVLNNYGTPSIHNEISWAFDDGFDDRICFQEVGGKWIDLHMHTSLRPTSLEAVRHRRTLVRETYRRIADCRTVILTLGLAECWYDRMTGLYLNYVPLRGTLNASPGRFELHVLSFEEAYRFLHDSLVLLERHAQPGLRVLLTVSPVPIQATYRDMDVMIANTYSKSVLRVAAEQAAIQFPFIDYFPSYESITLSDRGTVFEQDHVHVTMDAVKVNVNRMVDAYAGREDKSLEVLLEEIDLLQRQPHKLFNLLLGHEQHLGEPKIANAYVEGALASNRPEDALMAVEEGTGVLPINRARTFFMLEQHDRALRELLQVHDRSRTFFLVKLGAELALGRTDDAVQTANDWGASHSRDPAPFAMLAEHLSAQDTVRADQCFRTALSRADLPAITLKYAEHLARTGRHDQALELIADIPADTAAMQRRLTKLRERA